MLVASCPQATTGRGYVLLRLSRKADEPGSVLSSCQTFCDNKSVLIPQPALSGGSSHGTFTSHVCVPGLSCRVAKSSK